MLNNYNVNINDYLSTSPNFKSLNWDQLPNTLKLKLGEFPEEIKKLGNFVTVRRLRDVNKDIIFSSGSLPSTTLGSTLAKSFL